MLATLGFALNVAGLVISVLGIAGALDLKFRDKLWWIAMVCPVLALLCLVTDKFS